MLYRLLIYQSEEVSENYSEVDLREALGDHRTLQEKAKAINVFVAANELMSGKAATTVRERAGKATVTDGPFAETKELLVGLYFLDCENLDGAIEYAKLIPNVKTGSIEIRPINYFEGKTTG